MFASAGFAMICDLDVGEREREREREPWEYINVWEKRNKSMMYDC